MKRKQLWLWLLLLPPLLQSCEKKYPNAETIITGKIVDENDKPMEGVEFYFGGFKYKGISPIPTFSLWSKSNKAGVYYFSQIISSSSKNIEFYPSYLLNLPTNYKLNILINGDYLPFYGIPQKDGDIPSIKYGKTNTYNFKLVKK